VKFKWNPIDETFQSQGQIGIASIDKKQLFKYVKGKIEIEKKRGADVLRMYIELDPSIWYYFEYKLGIMNILSSDKEFGAKMSEIKDDKRRFDEGRNKYSFLFINNKKKRTELIALAAEKFGYQVKDVEVRLYAGKYAGLTGEKEIREWASKQILGGGPLQVVNALQLSQVINALAQESHYQNNVAIAFAKTQIEAQLIQARDAKAQAKEAKAKTPKPSSKGTEYMSMRDAEALFPIGSHVKSTKDGFEGIVIGYTQQQSAHPYVTVHNRETGVAKRRVVHSIKLVD
jgi:hypothetical protein